MNAILAAAIIFVVFAVGDMISAKTKAIVSMLLVASVVFLAGFWTGVFPTTLFADSCRYGAYRAASCDVPCGVSFPPDARPKIFMA